MTTHTSARRRWTVQQLGRGAALAALVSLSTPVATQAPTAKPGDAVTFIEAARTIAAFAKGQTLVDTATYKVLASRREAAGQVEVHARDTDIIYMLDGRATIITGGVVVDGKTTAQDEVRGARIDGGTPRTLVKGDMLIVPNGVPHWFSEVNGPMLCYIVKVTSARADSLR